jgi:cyclase
MKQMKWMLLIGSLLGVSAALSAQPQSLVKSVESVADGVWMAQTSKGVNAGWFLLGDEVIAVDAGSDTATGKELLAKIKETAGKPVRFLIITHAHGDHAGGIGPFVSAGATVICQERAGGPIAQLVSGEAASKAGVLLVTDSMAFYGGSRLVALYRVGPAHTQGDLVVYLPDDKVLFVGDVATNQKAPYMQSPDVDPKGWEQTLIKLTKLDVDRIVFGHGPLGSKDALTNTLTYVHKVNELAAKMISDNVPEDLIDANLHNIQENGKAISVGPEFVANVRAAMRAERASAGPASTTPAPSPVPTPASKKKG